MVRERGLRARAGSPTRPPRSSSGSRSTRSRAATCPRSSSASGSRRCSAATARRSTRTPARRRTSSRSSSSASTTSSAASRQRFKIIARYRAYHGSTLGALSATGQAMRRVGYEPLAPGFLHVAAAGPVPRRHRARRPRRLRPPLRRRPRAHDRVRAARDGRRGDHGADHHRRRHPDPAGLLPARRQGGVRAPRRAADRRRGDLRLRPGRARGSATTGPACGPTS